MFKSTPSEHTDRGSDNADRASSGHVLPLLGCGVEILLTPLGEPLDGTDDGV